MFCDARSTPPRVAAVLFVNGRIFWADMEPDESTLKAFRPRGDNHIMSLEILSIALGFSFSRFQASVSLLRLRTLQGLASFGPALEGRDVMIFSDNTAAEAACKRGVSGWARCVTCVCCPHMG